MWLEDTKNPPSPPPAASQPSYRVWHHPASDLPMCRCFALEVRRYLYIPSLQDESRTPKPCPVTVADRLDVGYMIKYRLQFDDGAVRTQCELVTVTREIIHNHHHEHSVAAGSSAVCSVGGLHPTASPNVAPPLPPILPCAV